jgi:hypothetical protein
VTLRGVGLHPKADAGEESLDWQEIFPELEKHPRQIDLMKATTNGPAVESVVGAAAVPAGIYDQLRLRLVPDPEGPEDQLPLKNECGALGFNCVIMADGRIQAPRFDGDASELRISSKALTDHIVVIPLDGEGELLIELTPVWSMGASLTGELRLLPVLTGRARSRPKSAGVEP